MVNGNGGAFSEVFVFEKRSIRYEHPTLFGPSNARFGAGRDFVFDWRRALVGAQNCGLGRGRQKRCQRRSRLASVRGGAGGNTDHDSTSSEISPGSGTSWHGPGGGGGGGTVLYSAGLSVSTNLAGGPAGFTNESGTTHVNHGAVVGSPGLSATLSAGDGNNVFDFSDACGPNVSVVKTTTTPSLPTSATSATNATYSITLSNTGAGGAAGAVVDDPLPSPFTYDPATNATATYAAGSAGPATIAGTGTSTARFGTAGGDASNSFVIGPGSSVTLVFPVKTNSAAAGKYDNSASVSYADPGRTTNTLLVSPGGTYLSGAAVPGTNYNGALPANTGEDVTLTGPLSGIVFDDPNFAGRSSTPTGGGRPFDAAKGMKGVNGARVELYNSDGTFNTFTTTATVNGQDGVYSFPGLANGVYFVRVVNSSVPPSRAASATGLLPVQTFQVSDETADTTNNATDFPNRLGGRFPALTDAASNTSNASLNTTTFALGGGFAQSVSRVEVRQNAAPSVSGTSQGLAFGFNFDTVVNTLDSGQGTLRQFVLNANALANAGLAQDGLTGGVETSIFSIPSPSDPLGRAADANFASGVAKITLASTLTLTGTNGASTAIDGTTQTQNVGDTNAGTFGTGGTVGVQNVPLPTLPRPEVEIYGPRTVQIGLDIAADSALVKGVAMWGFGTSGDNSSNATIRVGSSATSNSLPPTITQVLLGTTAVPGSGGALAVPSPALYGKGDLVRGSGVKGAVVSNSVLAYAGGKGVALQQSAANWTIQGNEIRGNARDSTAWDGIDAQVAGTQILENLVTNSGGTGIDSYSSGTSATIRNNTSTANGQNCAPTTGEPAGIRSYGTGNLIELNIIAGNYGAGILVQSTATTKITQNSIYGNGAVFSSASPNAKSGQIGIDLLKAGDAIDHGTLPFVTPNDAGDADTGANGLLNFPVISSATISGENLTLQGFAPPGATVEVFAALPDPTGFGQGQTYAFSFVEGSAADSDSTTGAYDAATLQALGYPASVAALVGSETNANRFRVVVPLGALSNSSVLTATATVGNNTSEFSPDLSISAAGASVSGLVYLDANGNGTRENAETGASLTGYFIKLVPQGATSATRVVAVAADGTYSFSGVAAGRYSLVLDNNATLSDIMPTVPAGYTATESAGGINSLAIGNTSLANQNFGLYAGFSISGRVFEDSGVGSGVANDAVQNGTEPGLSGVSVQLRSGATIIATTNTSALGDYSFSIPASYSGQTLSVVETNANGFVSSGGVVGNTGGTYSRTTDTLSWTFNTATGALTGANFADVRLAALSNDGAALGTRGGSVNYPHVFTAGTSGTVSFATSQVANPPSGWTTALYLDVNGNGKFDAGDSAITATSPAISVVAGQKLNLVVVNYSGSRAACYTSNPRFRHSEGSCAT